MKEGEKIITDSNIGCFVIKSVKRRNAAGNWENKKLSENSFFNAVCDFIPYTSMI